MREIFIYLRTYNLMTQNDVWWDVRIHVCEWNEMKFGAKVRYFGGIYVRVCVCLRWLICMYACMSCIV